MTHARRACGREVAQNAFGLTAQLRLGKNLCCRSAHQQKFAPTTHLLFLTEPLEQPLLLPPGERRVEKAIRGKEADAASVHDRSKID